MSVDLLNAFDQLILNLDHDFGDFFPLNKELNILSAGGHDCSVVMRAGGALGKN